MTNINNKTPFGMQVFATIVARLTINTAVRMLYPFLPAFSRGIGVPIETLIQLLSLRSALAMIAPVFGRLSQSVRTYFTTPRIPMANYLIPVHIWDFDDFGFSTDQKKHVCED